MKRSFFLLTLSMPVLTAQAQNVGIGTNQPQKLFSVNGTIVVDHDSRNNGSPDSAALLFGHNGFTGITSTKAGFINPNGLDLWTNHSRRLSINQNGYVGIGTLPDNIHRLTINGKLNTTGNISTDDSLHVNGSVGIGIAPSGFKLKVNGESHFMGSSYIDNNLSVDGWLGVNGTAVIVGTLESYNIRANQTLRVGNHAAIGGALDTNFRFRVYDGNSRLGGDAQVTGRMAIGGSMDDSYRLRVWDGNSRFGGNVEVTGQINTSSMSVDALSIGGKGSVKSDGLSPLRIGFASKYVDIVIPGGATEEYTVNITDFTGDNDDMRVSVSQFALTTGGTALAFERTLISVTSVNAENDTCKIKLHNTASGQLHLKGTIYLMCVAKN